MVLKRVQIKKEVTSRERLLSIIEWIIGIHFNSNYLPLNLVLVIPNTKLVFLQGFYNFFFYNFHQIKWYEAKMIISNVHLFSPFSVCMSAGSSFLAFLCPSIYGLAFVRMLMSRCLCAIVHNYPFIE